MQDNVTILGLTPLQVRAAWLGYILITKLSQLPIKTSNSEAPGPLASNIEKRGNPGVR